MVIGVTSAKRGRFTTSTRLYYLADTRAMVSKAPGYLFSSYTQTASRTPVLVSMDTYYELMKEAHRLSYKRNEPMPSRPPKRALYIRVRNF